MKTPIVEYRNAGKAAARARNEGNDKHASMWAKMFEASRKEETPEDAEKADKAYREAYAANRRA